MWGGEGKDGGKEGIGRGVGRGGQSDRGEEGDV